MLPRLKVTTSVLLSALLLLVLSSPGFGACPLVDSRGQAVLGNQDPVARVLATAETCPANVFEFRERLLKAGARIETTLVNNQGFHTPQAGNFSLFEIVSGRLSAPMEITLEPGQLLFGHFTARRGNTLIANQTPQGLMIELIAFDPAKQLFHFYELMGEGQRSRWFFRGDSTDILADMRSLHLQPNPASPTFGARLRCSGCHIGGGPIMKELAEPHNDWWRTSRPLPFGTLQPDPTLGKILEGLVDAGVLARTVRAGTAKLEKSPTFQAAKAQLSLPEQLRSLFCPIELNLESDAMAFDANKEAILVPSAFLVDPRLARAQIPITRSHYEAALAKMKTRFPGTNRPDADHAWLAPVKGASDILAAEALVSANLIDEEFLIDVLSVDFTNPLLSKSRCELVRLLPASTQGDWQSAFMSALKTSTEPAARALLTNLTNPDRTAQFHKKQAAGYLERCQGRLKEAAGVVDLFRILAERRAQVFESEISKNPEGQILEPGEKPGALDDDRAFKKVFPVSPDFLPFTRRPQPHVTPVCEVLSE